MSHFDHETVMQILSDVLASPEEQRLRCSIGRVTEIPRCRPEIEELLRCEPQAARLFGDEAVDLEIVAAQTRIGPYRLQEQIGEGGMGSVYKAEQQYPIRRTVAIKIIKLGMDTREVIARLKASDRRLR